MEEWAEGYMKCIQNFGREILLKVSAMKTKRH
jgi:hypothetical protein